jgi:ECF transporter S component (folate family)
MQLVTLFRRSAAELRNPRCLALTALFISLNIAMDLLNIRIQLTQTIRIGPGFLCNACVGMLFGPVVAMLAGICTDTLGYLVNSGGGAYFPGYMLTAMLAGVFHGIFLYSAGGSRSRLIIRSVLDKACINVFCNMGLNTLWLSMLYGDSFLVLLPARALKNLLMLPFESIALVVVTEIVFQINSSHQHTTNRSS